MNDACGYCVFVVAHGRTDGSSDSEITSCRIFATRARMQAYTVTRARAMLAGLGSFVARPGQPVVNVRACLRDVILTAVV